MATAVGRGRSRGIRSSTRPPGVAATTATSSPAAINPDPGAATILVNHQPPPPIPQSESSVSTPPPAPSNTLPSPHTPVTSQPNPPEHNPFLAAVSQFEEARNDSVASQCLNIIRNPSKRTMSECFDECKRVMSDKLAEADVRSWVDVSIQSVYGDINLTRDFVQLIASIQQDQNFALQKETLRMVLRSLGLEKERLKSSGQAYTDDTITAQANYIVLLAEAALYVTMNNGAPILPLTNAVMEFLPAMCVPTLPDEVYTCVHHVLVRYGSTLEEYLSRVADANTVALEMERLYDGIRGVIIHDSTTDKSRLKMLELVERRAYQYNMPQECLNYFNSN